jgi:hypothetical protein
VALVVDVLDGLFGLPVTLGAVGPHHPLESPAVAGSADAVPRR